MFTGDLRSLGTIGHLLFDMTESCRAGRGSQAAPRMSREMCRIQGKLHVRCGRAGYATGTNVAALTGQNQIAVLVGDAPPATDEVVKDCLVLR